MSAEQGNRYNPLRDPNYFTPEIAAANGLKWDHASRQWVQRADIQDAMMLTPTEQAPSVPTQASRTESTSSADQSEYFIGRRKIEEDGWFLRGPEIGKILSGVASGMGAYARQQAAQPPVTPPTHEFTATPYSPRTEQPTFEQTQAYEADIVDDFEEPDLGDQLEGMDINARKAAEKEAKKAEKLAAKEARRKYRMRRLGRTVVVATVASHAVFAGSVAAFDRSSNPEYLLFKSDIKGNADKLYSMVEPIVGMIK